ncbi:MAG TPA: RluA family pseudouridine synthase [Fastidiosipila sp.]|nr:RluA family pseudouridine synthase [Fastidiosipila sp.]
MAIDIVYEDNHILVCLKPVFMPSQADRSGKPDLCSTLASFIKIRDEKPGNVFMGLVHRLDQPVSGLMVFAKTSKAAKRLADQFRLDQVDKYYLAITHGAVDNTPDRWRDFLSTKTKNGRYFVTEESRGKEAVMYIDRMAYEKDADLSLVQIKLMTGRSHQIRVQCQSRGYPLLGDRRYGNELTADLNTPSIALYASALAFTHPVKKTPLLFVDIPDIPAFQGFSKALTDDALSCSRAALAAYQEMNP